MRNPIFRLGAMLAMVMLLGLSCSRMHENLEECPTGLRLRFVYDYNMEFANGFPKQVDCLTLLVYDDGGRYVKQASAFKPETADENWRMDLALEPGRYILLAYGGMECTDASFSFVTPPEDSSLEDLQVRLDKGLLSMPKKPLHHLFYGRKEVEVPEPAPGSSYTEETVYMMKDTNDFRIILANENLTPVDADEFEFSITADNTLMDYKNDVIKTGSTLYPSWTKGTDVAGFLAGGEEAIVAYAEISTGRIIYKGDMTLEVRRKGQEEPVISLAMSRTLLLLKSERYDYMGEQEFLDRTSDWNLTFFLAGDGTWSRAKIIINDWTVRYNFASLL